MNIVGIVAEYNPFHNGHFFHLNKAKELSGSEYSVAIMSSNFVQRGEPAIFSKWQRAEMAVKNGVDLVLELPVLFSSRSAYYFAFGSIYSLVKSNTITHLAFGSESKEIGDLKIIADYLSDEQDEYKEMLKSFLHKGLSFPKARELALKNIFPEIKINLNQPNVILGINYLKVLKELNSEMIPVTIERIGSYHGLKPVDNIAGATLVRNLIKDNNIDYKNYLTEETNKIIDHIILEGYHPVFLKDFSTQIMYLLRTLNKDNLLQYPGIKEGLEHKIVNSLDEAFELEELINKINSKRYTETRIKRIFTEILLGIKRDLNPVKPEYLKVLALNKKGRDVLNIMKEKSTLPIITKFADFYRDCPEEARKLLDLDIRATNIYSQVQSEKKFQRYNQEFINSPVYLP